MPDAKISALLAAAALTGAEALPVVQAGVTTKTTVDQIKTYFKVGVRDIVSVLDTAGVGNTYATNSTVGIQAAVTAVGNNSLWFPPGKYKLDDQIVPAYVGQTINIIGAGSNAVEISQYTNTKGAFKFQSNGKGGISGVTLVGTAGTGASLSPGSTGIGLHLVNCGNNFNVDDVHVYNFDTSFRPEGCNGYNVTRCSFSFFTNFGIDLPAFPATQLEGHFDHIVISNGGFTTPAASIGLSIKGSGGDFFSNMDIIECGKGVVIAPPAGSYVLYCNFENVLADTSINDNWTVDGTNGPVQANEANGCWGAYSTNGAGLVTKGASLDDFKWLGGHLRENGKQGWHHQGGLNVEVNGASINANSKLMTNTYDGVLIVANVSKWALLNSPVGNFASTLGHSQANGVVIEAGTSTDARIENCNLGSPGAGKVSIVNGSTSPIMLSGNLPLQTAGLNTMMGEDYAGATIATIAAATTRYLGPNAEQVNESAGQYVMSKAGVCTQLVMLVSSAPGAGQTYTFTVRKNGVATAMTGAISGGASFAVTLTTAFTFAATDSLSIQVVTSAGAVACLPRWVLSTTP